MFIKFLYIWKVTLYSNTFLLFFAIVRPNLDCQFPNNKTEISY